MASESKSERTFVCDIRECRQYRIPPCGRLGLEARQDGSAGLWREARRAERIGDDQEAAAFTLTFASFGGETAIRARPMNHKHKYAVEQVCAFAYGQKMPARP